VPGATEIGVAAWNACANPEGRADPHPFHPLRIFSRPAGAVRLGDGARRLASPAIWCWATMDAILPTYLKAIPRANMSSTMRWAEALEQAGGIIIPAASLGAVHAGHGGVS